VKCPKCGYTSFDYLRACKKCGELLDDSRKALNLKINEPTLFAGLEHGGLEAGGPEVDKAQETPPGAAPYFPETDFSPLTDDSQPISSALPTQEEQRSEALSEDISSGLSSELETLGNMDELYPRPENKEILPNIELESSSGVEGLELNPSFNTDSDRTEESPEEEKSKEDEFVLFADEDKDDQPVTGGEPLENDIPFEFSTNDLENDISLSVPSDTTDKDMIELELDMEDEESLDQILADLGGNGNSKK